jgi:carbon monoxide dehydrogenase subunit G
VRLENAFEVPASPEAAWALLNDVPRVVPCMPGAELTEVVGENEWKAKLSVKLGPISLQFATDVTRTEADEQARRVTLAAKARELRGRGGASATIESSLAPSEAGAGTGTRVTIVTDLSLQGAVAQYGRGVVADVSNQLTKRFAECIASQLAEAPPAAGGDGGPSQPTAPPPTPHVAEPISGLRLGLGALWRTFLGVFRRR